MAGYDMDNVKWAKEIPGILHAKAESEKNRSMRETKRRSHEDLFVAGQMWQIKGKSLDEARQDFKYKQRKMTDAEYTDFIKGYIYMIKDVNVLKEIAYELGKKEVKAETLPLECSNNKDFMDLYCEGLGFTCGYKGLSVHELPTKFVGKKAFLIGYRKGIQEKAKEEPENKKRR